MRTLSLLVIAISLVISGCGDTSTQEATPDPANTSTVYPGGVTAPSAAPPTRGAPKGPPQGAIQGQPISVD